MKMDRRRACIVPAENIMKLADIGTTCLLDLDNRSNASVGENNLGKPAKLINRESLELVGRVPDLTNHICLQT